MTGLLEGVRVLDFAHMMQGPWGAEMLADMGADVIKVESLQGERGRQSGTVFIEGRSAQYLAMNKNKRSIAVDLKSEEGRRLVQELIRDADVIVQNFRPGAMERLGLGYDDVRALNSGIVYCSASGYGTAVPDVRRPGQDLLAQARTGAMWLTGTRADGPVPCGPFVADIHGATMLALAAAAALVRRARTGEGAHVEIDLIGAMLHMQVQELSSSLNSGVPVVRHARPGSAYIEAPYGSYSCADGRWLALSLTTGEQLAQALDVPEIASRFPTKREADEQRDDLYRIVAEAIASRPLSEWLERCEAAGVWAAPVNDYREMQDDPYVGWEQRRVEIEVGGSSVELMNNPVRIDGEALAVRLAPPELGEHTDDVLHELGLTDERIDELRSSNVIR